MDNTDEINQLSGQVVDAAFKVHKAMGPGLLESAYQECMEKELHNRKIPFARQPLLPLYYEGEQLDTTYRLDFLIDECLVVELKCVEKLLPVHEAQLLTYLKLTGKHLGLLINFSSPLIKDGIKRIIL